MRIADTLREGHWVGASYEHGTTGRWFFKDSAGNKGAGSMKPYTLAQVLEAITQAIRTENTHFMVLECKDAPK